MSLRRLVLLAIGSVALVACRDEALVAAQGCTLTAAPTGLIMQVGDTSQVGATGHCERGNLPPIRWSTSTPSVVTVDSISGIVHARGLGAANVTATVVGMPSVSGVVHVSVSGSTCGNIASVGVAPASVTLSIGGSAQLTAIARVGCDTSSSPVSWVSADTAIAGVDSTGRVVGRRLGATVVSAISRLNPNLIGRAAVSVGSTGPLVSGLTVSPDSVMIAATDTVRLRATVTLGAGAPAGTSTGVTYRSADSCAATVDSTGLVTALSFGFATKIIVSAIAAPTVTQQVTIAFLPPPPVPALLLQGLTTGTPPVDADRNALRGTVTAVAGVLRAALLGSGRAELRLGGRLAAEAAFPRFAPGEWMARVPLTVNTAARDSTGAALFPNGATTLELRVMSDGVPPVAGCPVRVPAGWTAIYTMPVTIANP